MKKLLLNIIAISLSLVVVWGSSGVNIYHYCCDVCEDHGFEMFTSMSCDDAHNEHSCCDHSEPTCCDLSEECDHLSENSDDCGSERTEAITLLHESESEFSVGIEQPILSIFTAVNDFHIVDISKRIDPNYSSLPPPLSGRLILLKKDSLTI